MKYYKRIILISFLVSLFVISVSCAHSGRTDANGGHYDRSTGEYHYHHGYPAHQHPNGICPYSNTPNINNSRQNNTRDEDTKKHTNNIINWIFEHDTLTFFIVFIFIGAIELIVDKLKRK